MPGNAQPQFTLNGNIGSVLVTAANTNTDGSGTIATNIFLAFTAGANGSYVDFLRWIAVATSASSTTQATAARIFISSKTSGNTTSAETYLIAEVSIPSLTVDTTTASAAWFDVPLGFRLPAGWTLLVTNHEAPAANTNQRAVVIGGDY